MIYNLDRALVMRRLERLATRSPRMDRSIFSPVMDINTTADEIVEIYRNVCRESLRLVSCPVFDFPCPDHLRGHSEGDKHRCCIDYYLFNMLTKDVQ